MTSGDGFDALAGFSAGGHDAGPGLVMVDADLEPGRELVVPVAFPAVVVAVSTGARGGRLAAAADLALTAQPDPPRPWVHTGDPAAAAEAIAATVAAPRSAGAAAALVQVLRAGRRLEVDSGLVLESLAYSVLQSGPAFASWRAERPARPPDLCAGDEVLIERQDDLLRVVLNRPARHNAYNRCMRDLLLEALAVAAADPAVKVELSGRGPSFCSGGDLDEFGSFPDPVTSHLIRVGRSPARLIADLSGRVTARVHGACAGSGIELPAFAGTVLARPGTRFWLPELAMGLIPGAGGTVSLARRIGRQRTAWMALTGQAIDVPTALAWGLIDGVD